jgi:CRP/FNR family transcriptional regulator
VGEGRVKIFRTGAQGREQVLHVEGPGATLEEVPLFDRAGYVASAAAQTDALLLWLSRREIEALCRRHPEVALAIIATMAAGFGPSRAWPPTWPCAPSRPAWAGFSSTR